MKIELQTKIEIINGEEFTIWQLNKNDGAIVITLNKTFDYEIIECGWLDDKQQFLEIMYGDFNGNELFAIINKHGTVVRDAIRGIMKYLEGPQLFIVEMSGSGMGIEGMQYGLGEDEWKFAVVNAYGHFVIPPEYWAIYFDDEENTFYSDKYFGKEVNFTIKGEKIY